MLSTKKFKLNILFSDLTSKRNIIENVVHHSEFSAHAILQKINTI